jgi:hypothetical protein
MDPDKPSVRTPTTLKNNIMADYLLLYYKAPYHQGTFQLRPVASTAAKGKHPQAETK